MPKPRSYLLHFTQETLNSIAAAGFFLFLCDQFNHAVGEYELILTAIIALTSYLVYHNTELCTSIFDFVTNKADYIFKGWGVVAGVMLLVRLLMDFQTIHSVPRIMLIVWIFVTPLVLLLAQIFAWRILNYILKIKKSDIDRVVIIGVNHVGVRIAGEINKNPLLGKKFLGFFDDRSPDRLIELDDNLMLGKTDELIKFVQDREVDSVYISLPMSAQDRIFHVIRALQDSTASIYFLPDIFVFDLIQARFDTIQGIPIVAVCETPFYGINAIKKRVFDIVVSIFSLILLSPVLATIAILVKTTSKGPAIFKQRRYGMGGEEIVVYKFRSMRVMEDGAELTQATKDDPRITPIGKFLRRSSLDEIPQFINVLQGRMSLVGPRPHAVAHNEEYRKIIKGYMLRHKAQPGITGWAQVNGLRGEIRKLEDMEARTNFDLDYLRCWSLSFDVWILIKTVIVVIRGNNAY
ncbi:MAG: undecaprenyl-phosphate glucose phosphotransferase [Magnetococcales bacterium]|nr:undecaprenyl-phosphate glucose phosphotransferase [Magnetococcales bacterium]